MTTDTTEKTGTTGNAALDDVPVGAQLESFEYVITQEMLDEYRRIVDDPNAAYPTVAGRHPLRAWMNMYGASIPVLNAGAESEYFNPVIPGKRIRVRAVVADKYMSRGKPYVLVDSSAVDEDGRMIEKSRLIGIAAQDGKPLFSEVTLKWNNN